MNKLGPLFEAHEGPVPHERGAPCLSFSRTEWGQILCPENRTFDGTAASQQYIDDLGETIVELLNEDGASLDESRKKLEIFLVVDAGGKATDIKLMEMLAKKRK